MLIQWWKTLINLLLLLPQQKTKYSPTHLSCPGMRCLLFFGMIFLQVLVMNGIENGVMHFYSLCIWLAVCQLPYDPCT